MTIEFSRPLHLHIDAIGFFLFKSLKNPACQKMKLNDACTTPLFFKCFCSFHRDDNGIAFKNFENHFQKFAFSDPQNVVAV